MTIFSDSLWDPANFKWSEAGTISSWKVIPTTWILYLGSILILWLFMKDRKPFNVKRIAAIHNIILCILSAVMFLGITLNITKEVSDWGLRGAYCQPQGQQSEGSMWYWFYIYYLSKFLELFDTVLIVLGKKPLIFLHVYHHAIVILMVWLWIEDTLTYGRYRHHIVSMCVLKVLYSVGVAFNTFIHVIMYYYYFITSLGQTVWWKHWITKLQIIQFVSSFVLAVPYLYYVIGHDHSGNFVPQCTGWNAFLFSCLVNGSFLALFIRFFKSAYTQKERKTQ